MDTFTIMLIVLGAAALVTVAIARDQPVEPAGQAHHPERGDGQQQQQLAPASSRRPTSTTATTSVGRPAGSDVRGARLTP